MAVRTVWAGLRSGLIALTLPLCAGAAHAGLFDDEEARRAILDLRQRIEQLKQESEQKLSEEARRASEESAQLRRALVDLQNQLEASRAEIAKLRGQDEQLARDVADLQRKQKDGAQQLDERLRKLEPVRVSVDGREFAADPNEKRDFEAALAVFRRGEFAPAQNAFVDFLNRYGSSGYRPSALFWLGNAQYATKDYKEAQANFRSLVQQAGDHLRVPEALLAIANCQQEMKDSKAAKKTLEELVAKYPGNEAAVVAKERLARLK
ncbi:tol-pal system protein YbgF [uncultured Rhodoferax sp.]|uniref:tol-pal system protein YbgF n=1 Tax=uncultured Rhodoferax sp. TaxID=223188 RepID=UPI0025F84CA3|nr:tol-pal system protein YbgF [uncultured Rhodoferax sp.]